MNYPFSKYSGCGNDFILFDNRSDNFPPITTSLIISLCHRQNGIGADGVIFLETSLKCDFKMRIFNSDGSEAEMCGNGIRCLARFIEDCGVMGNQFTIETMLRKLSVYLEDDDVSVEMGQPKEMLWNLSLDSYSVHHLDTGVPHAVIFCDDSSKIDVETEGSKIRNHPQFAPRGANANFAHIDSADLIHVRTFERGVEGETLACGTGATATALAAAKIYNIASPIRLKVRSEEILKVSFVEDSGDFSHVLLTGPAKKIFTGTIYVHH